MAKVKWSQLRKEYIADETVTHKSLAEKYGVNEVNVSKRAAKEHWSEQRREALEISKEKTIENTGETLAEVNARHLELARKLQTNGSIAIEAMPIKSHREGRESITDGITIERKVLGFDQTNVSFNQQNNTFVTSDEFFKRVKDAVEKRQAHL